MEDGKTNEGDTGGKETPDDSKKPEEDNKSGDGISALDRAEAANKEKSRLIDEEKKLMDRKEKLHAAQMVGGHTQAGQTQEQPKNETDKEYRQRVEKELKEGRTEFGN